MREWEAVRASGDIQFAPVKMPEQAPPPDWLVRFLKFLSEMFRPVAEGLGLSWPVFKWVLLAIAALCALALLWRLLAPSPGFASPAPVTLRGTSHRGCRTGGKPSPCWKMPTG